MKKRPYLVMRQFLSRFNVLAAVLNTETELFGKTGGAHAPPHADDFRIDPAQVRLVATTDDLDRTDGLQRDDIRLGNRIGFICGREGNQCIVDTDACRNQPVEMRKGAGIGADGRSIAFHCPLDHMQRQAPLLLQTPDGLNALDVFLAIVGDVGLGPVGLGHQAMAEIDPDGFAIDAGTFFEIPHFHGRLARCAARSTSI